MSYLPPGYRFNPEDEELISHYLWRRLLYGESPCCPRMPLVNNIFGEEADHPSIVFDSFGNPDRQEEDNVRYFFTIPKTVANDKSCAKTVANDKSCAKNRIRAAGKYGTWKLQRSDPVMAKNTNGEEEVVGFRKLLKFMESKGVGVAGVEWSMHEFSSSKMEENNFNKYVLCRITKKVSNKIIGKKRPQESDSCSSSSTCNNRDVMISQEIKRQHVRLNEEEQGVSEFGSNGSSVSAPVLQHEIIERVHVQEGCGDQEVNQGCGVSYTEIGINQEEFNSTDFLALSQQEQEQRRKW